MSELSEGTERRKNEGGGRDGDTETETNLNSHLKCTLLCLKNHLMPFSPPVSVITVLKHSKALCMYVAHMYVAKPTKRKKTLVLFLVCSYFN